MMRQTSSIYKEIISNVHRKENRLLIAGIEYRDKDIISLSTSGAIFPGISIGNAAARQINMIVRPISAIPRQAKIEVFVRVTDGTRTSEWIPKGVFFFATRETDKISGDLSVQGFDAMLKAEDTWLTSDYSAENWPMEPDQAVADIANRIGVNVDNRTKLDPAFLVQYPVGEDGELTMRDVLRRIAVANAGNWIITDAGELLLISLNSIPAETNYLVDELGGTITVGSVRILV